MPEPDSALAVLKSFVSIKGTKKQMNTEEISGYAQTFGKNLEGQDLQSLLQSFVNLRILRDKDENGRYELRHDALATKIYEKITLVEKEILEIRQFIENAFADYEKRKLYLDPDDLRYIAPYEDKLFLNRRLSDFVETSKNNILARKRAFIRTLSYSAAGFLIILVSIAVYSFRSNITARSEELSTESFLQNSFSPSLSFQTALNAYNKDTASTLAIKALSDAFYAMLDQGTYYDSLENLHDPQKAIFDFTPCKSRIKYARFSGDGKYIYGFLEDNTVNLWDIKGKLIFSRKDNPASVVALKLSPDNEHIAAAYLDSTALFWNLTGEIIYKSDIVFDPLNPADVIDFCPGKKIMTILDGSNRLRVHNLEDDSDYELEGHAAKPHGAVFSPDGRLIASASKDSTVIIWQYNDSTGFYQKANRLKEIKSVVWSVRFAGNSKYILTVSDSVKRPVIIWRVTGGEAFGRQFYNDTIERRYLARFPNNYHGRYFYAEFTSNDEAIRISTFSNKISLAMKTEFEPLVSYYGYDHHRIIYSKESFHLVPMSNFLKNYGIDRKGQALDPADQFNYAYSFVDVSPKYIAANISGTSHSILIRLDRLPIRKFSGIQPLFSPDGNYLLCIDGNDLKLYPVDEKEIIRLVTEELIFGVPDSDPSSWSHFLKDW